MDYNKLEHFVSVPRLDRFLNACGGSKPDAQQLYKDNLRVAESFYPVLHLFEVFLRNAINTRLTDYFGNPDWIIIEKKVLIFKTNFPQHLFRLRNSFKMHFQVVNSFRFFFF